MDLLLIAAGILAIILIVLVIKFVHSILKAAIYFAIILAIFSAIAGYFIYKDANELSLGLSQNSTMFVLKDNKTIIAAFTMDKMNISTARSFDKSQLSTLQASMDKKEYGKMIGTSYKLFIIDKSAFPKTEKFDTNVVVEALKDEKELKLLDQIKPKTMPDSKAAAFAMLVLYGIKEDPGFLLKEYQNGTLTMYPENLSFKIYRMLGAKK